MAHFFRLIPLFREMCFPFSVHMVYGYYKIILFVLQCKKIFPRRQNYHFHKTKGRCPGAPQPPKYHKLHESKYYCVHPDCGSGDGEIRENTPCFTSRGIYWKHLAEKHIRDQDKVQSP